jgi:hypothetical protein
MHGELLVSPIVVCYTLASYDCFATQVKPTSSQTLRKGGQKTFARFAQPWRTLRLTGLRRPQRFSAK